MAIKRNRVKLDKKDFLRASLTDTAPSDVPIIFSNDGLYINAHRASSDSTSDLVRLVKLLFTETVDISKSSMITSENKRIEKQNALSFPLKYKIIKNEISLRTLSLLHPRSQYNSCVFYRDNSDVISYLCSLSTFSIRAPKRVANSFYARDKHSVGKYKGINIDTLENELDRKHASSFFAYRGFDRLYKLYDSSQYLSLEKQFPTMWFLDVANCFDSIYTHTISWAAKNKEFIKKHVHFKNHVCQAFDTLMQRSNNNETNGIPIGAETSTMYI